MVTTGSSPPLSVMVTGSDADTAVMEVALPWVIEGGLARVSKESEGVAQEVPAELVARAVKR